MTREERIEALTALFEKLPQKFMDQVLDRFPEGSRDRTQAVRLMKLFGPPLAEALKDLAFDMNRIFLEAPVPDFPKVVVLEDDEDKHVCQWEILMDKAEAVAARIRAQTVLDFLNDRFLFLFHGPNAGVIVIPIPIDYMAEWDEDKIVEKIEAALKKYQ